MTTHFKNQVSNGMRQFAKTAILTLVFFICVTPASAANLPLFDPSFSIVPSECTVECPCGAGAILQFIQNIMNAAISVGVIAFLFIIVYAGFLFISSPTNPEAHSKAKSMITNAAIG